MNLIDKDETIKRLGDAHFKNYGNAIMVIRETPTVNAEPVRHGRWIRDEFGAKCGACGLYAYRDKFDQPWESPYCPNCGAKMDATNEH